jgi:hypothetical protein
MAGLFESYEEIDKVVCQQNVSYLIEQGIIDREQGEQFIANMVVFEQGNNFIPLTFLTVEGKRKLRELGINLEGFFEPNYPGKFNSILTRVLKMAVIEYCPEFLEFWGKARDMSKNKSKNELIREHGESIEPDENLNLSEFRMMFYNLWVATCNEEERNKLMLYAALYLNIFGNELEEMVFRIRQFATLIPISPTPTNPFAPANMAKTKTK